MPTLLPLYRGSHPLNMLIPLAKPCVGKQRYLAQPVVSCERGKLGKKTNSTSYISLLFYIYGKSCFLDPFDGVCFCCYFQNI